MSVLAPVLLIFVICGFLLIALRILNNQGVPAKELKEAKRQARVATAGLKQIQLNIGAQIAAGYPDLTALAVDVQDTLDDMQEPERKEVI